MRWKDLLDFIGERVEDRLLRDQFALETKALSLRMLRLTTLIGMFLFPLFGTLDVVVYPRLYPVLWGLRFLEVAFCALIFFFLKSRLVRERTPDVGMVLMIFSCLDIVAMCWLTGGPASGYYAGINLTILVVIFVMILDVKRVLAACAVIYACFMAPLWIRPASVVEISAIVSNSYFLLITMLLAVLWTLLKNRNRLNELKGRLDLARANEELKRLDVMKSQFFANVSHEVRTPLTSILGPVQSLWQGDAGAVTADQRILLESTYRNGLKLLDLINQMLDFSKIEAGRMPLRLKETDLAARIRDTVVGFRTTAERRGIALEFRLLGSVRPVEIDEEKFERILTNLVRNAIKFTERGSILLTLKEEGAFVVLEVEDTGIGIAAEYLPTIFDRFQQVDGSSTRKFEGTGIGLTLVKEYVELMKGRLSVASAPGKGTRFRIELPTNLAALAPEALRERRRTAAGGAPAPLGPGEDGLPMARRRDDSARISVDELAWMDRHPPLKEVEASAGPGGAAVLDRVLLAEDNSDLRTYIQTMLTKLGHEVAVAPDGLEAWEAARKNPPDIIVSDIMMPQLDGYELLRLIKETPGTRHIPVILITAKSDLDARLKGYEHGADDYLTKPVQVRELDARIRNLVAGRQLQVAVARVEEMKTRVDERQQGLEKLRRTLEGTVRAVAMVIEMRDPYTAGHQRRVADLARAIGAEMGLADDRLDGLYTAGTIHDIGKINVPAEILSRPTKLTEIEFGMIMTHVQAGYDILKDIEFPWPVARMVLEHHEKMDGSGYPNGRRGDELLPESRILAVADAVEAISSHRPYRPALGIEVALTELVSKRGIYYDHEATDACVRMFREKGYSIPG
jgi:putative two-component system response regulator